MFFYKFRIQRSEAKLEELKKQQINKLQDLKKTMDFKRNFNLLLNYSFKLSKLSPNEDIDLLFGEIDFEQLISCAQKHQELIQKEKTKKKIELKEKKIKDIKLTDTVNVPIVKVIEPANEKKSTIAIIYLN